MNFKTALTNAGFTGQLLAAWMPWTGNPSRVNHSTLYVQTSISVVKAQVACMKAAGFDGVVAVWQGPTHIFTDLAFTLMADACLASGMTFITMLDPWIAKGTANPTQSVIAALSSDFFEGMMQFSPGKYVLEFDLANSAGVNVAAVQAALPNMKILSWHVGYAWSSPLGDPATLQADNAKPSCIFPCVYYQFNDGGLPLPNGVGSPSTFKGQRDWNQSVWGGGVTTRIADPGAGGLYLDTVSYVPKTAQYAMFSTWNDWDEGTAIEGFCSAASGIRIA